jgi:hypothetical protein
VSLDHPSVVGIALTGSHARGDATPLSDVDILCFVETLPDDESQHYQLHYHGEVLVSVSMTTLADKHGGMNSPQSAIFGVPGLRQMRILLDKRGELAALQAKAQAFTWAPLQPAADGYASYQLMGCVEEVHKILNGLRRNNEAMLIYAILGLSWGMISAVAVQRGLLIDSENIYLQSVQESVGLDSAWTRTVRIVYGLDEDAGTNYSPIRRRAQTALQLYRETALLLDQIIRAEHRAITNRALGLIERS